MSFKILKNNELPLAIYSPPTPSYVVDGKKFDSRITSYHYKKIAEMGANIVFGHIFSECGTKAEHDYAITLAGENGLVYLLRHEIFEEFWSYGRKYPLYSRLDVDKRANLELRFKAVLQEYDKYPAFGGVAFIDEPGEVGFEGIRAAQDIFKKLYPNKLFYVNMFGYWITGEQMKYSAGKGVAPDKYLVKPKEKRYENFINDYLDVVNPEVMSYDLYPMVTLNGLQNSVHIALYDIFNLLKRFLNSKNKNIDIWAFIQAGGRWEESLNTRVVGYSEIALQANALLAMGAKGLNIFPYCFPDCWVGDINVDAGLLLANGAYSVRYDYFKKVYAQIKKCQDVFTSWDYVGFMLSGIFNGGLPPKEDLLKLPDGECYFCGDFESDYKINNFSGVNNIETTSQLLIGCFSTLHNEKALYLVNNSITNAVSAKINLNNAKNIITIKNAVFSKQSSQTIKCNLSPGESMLVKFCL